MSERAAADPATVEYIKDKQPLAEGFLEPSQMANAAAFLLSDESVHVTGQVLSVDGGWGVTETAP
jgi:NAD(P)-dependent dehydrogenase (short-subunit alcohol dehydrogenase family)